MYAAAAPSATAPITPAFDESGPLPVEGRVFTVSPPVEVPGLAGALRVSSGSSPRSRSHSCSSRCPCRSPCRCRTGRSRRRRGSCSRARNRHRGSTAGRPAHRACRFRSRRAVTAVQLQAAIGGQDHVWRAGLAPGDAIRMAPAFAAELAIAAVMVLAAFALVQNPSQQTSPLSQSQ